MHIELRDKGIVGRFIRRPRTIPIGENVVVECRFSTPVETPTSYKKSVHALADGTVKITGWTEIHLGNDLPPTQTGPRLDFTLGQDTLRRGYTLFDSNLQVISR